MTLAFERAVSSAASLRTFARSAPVKPGVRRATDSRSTSGETGLPCEWTLRICRRPFMSGLSTGICRSKRPGRSSAGSRTSGRFVAAMRMTPPRTSKPSISTRSWLRVCSRSSCPPPMPAPRWRPTASISSMKTMAGAFSLACSKRSRTRLAPTPTNISTKSEPEMEKNGTPASPATARASSVLPGTGLAVEQHALGDLGADGLELRRLGQELLDLLELLDRLVGTGDVGERGLRACPCWPPSPWTCRTA